MDKIVIKEENVVSLLETRFIKVYDLQYAEGKHYFDATRREKKDLTAIKSDEEFKTMTADAVTCVVILETPDEEPRLFLQVEYRYPAGQFLLAPPAGLLDKEDLCKEDPLREAARREIKEETGLDLTEQDTFRVLNPLVFSTPGMTDESNALVLAVCRRPDLSAFSREISQDGAEGTECFNGYYLLTKEKAAAILSEGRDFAGNFYSAYTQIALLYFVSDLWK